MQKGNYLSALLRSPKTVFTFKDLAMLWQETASTATKVRINYYVNKGDLIRIRKGIYAKTPSYNKLELATRIFTPAYISFETVLTEAGLIFQVYEAVYAASYKSREITIAGYDYIYRKIKDAVLINPAGVEHRDETSIATKERAFLDTMYVNSDYHFDNLREVDWEKVFEILPIYENKRMEKAIQKLYSKLEEK